MTTATQTVIIIVLLLVAIPIVLSDILHKFHVSEYSSVGPTIAGPAFCHTCGKQTAGAYYCSEACYPEEEE